MLAIMVYPGGKNGAGVYQTIINLMPPHDVYIEPFLGGGAIMRQKRPALLNIGVDLDPSTIARFNDDAGPVAGSVTTVDALEKAGLIGPETPQPPAAWQ